MSNQNKVNQCILALRSTCGIMNFDEPKAKEVCSRWVDSYEDRYDSDAGRKIVEQIVQRMGRTAVCNHFTKPKLVKPDLSKWFIIGAVVLVVGMVLSPLATVGAGALALGGCPPADDNPRPYPDQNPQRGFKQFSQYKPKPKSEFEARAEAVRQEKIDKNFAKLERQFLWWK